MPRNGSNRIYRPSLRTHLQTRIALPELVSQISRYVLSDPRESADASIASVPVEGYRCQLTKQASCHSYLERPASERPSRGPEVEDHHRYGVVHPGREPTDGHRLQRPHMNSSRPAPYIYTSQRLRSAEQSTSTGNLHEQLTCQRPTRRKPTYTLRSCITWKPTSPRVPPVKVSMADPSAAKSIGSHMQNPGH